MIKCVVLLYYVTSGVIIKQPAWFDSCDSASDYSLKVNTLEFKDYQVISLYPSNDEEEIIE